MDFTDENDGRGTSRPPVPRPVRILALALSSTGDKTVEMKFAVLVLFGALALSAADPAPARLPTPATGMDPARLTRIPKRMQEFVDAHTAAGIVTLVARHGKVAALDAVGFQELETKTPMKPDTIFRIASLTKPITCAGIMMLVDEGRVSLLESVSRYIPEFSALPHVTVLDLMAHTSGLPGSFPSGAAPVTLVEQAATAAKLALLFEPGKGWNYSNVGYATLGRIIEVASKKPYDEFLSEKLFTPLGMKDTTFFPADDRKSRIAAVYTEDHGALKRATQAEADNPNHVPAPQGGLFSTAADLFRFNQMILNKGILAGHRVLSAAAVETMGTSMTDDLPRVNGEPPRIGFAPGVGHGLGYEVVRDARGTYRYNSVGSLVKGGAYRTYEFIDPAKDLVGIILLQRTNGGGDVADEINVFLAMAAAAIEK